MGDAKQLLGETAKDRDASAPEPDSPRRAERTYEVLCISMYKTDVASAKAMVAELKARGIRRASLSWLIRLALSRLDLDAISEADRP